MSQWDGGNLTKFNATCIKTFPKKMVSVVPLQTSMKLNLLFTISTSHFYCCLSFFHMRSPFRHNLKRFPSTRSHQRCFRFTPFLSMFYLHAAGENVKEFFFRVASLAFETSVLSELEKGGSKQIGDVVRKYPLSVDTHGNKKKKKTKIMCLLFRNQQQFKESVHNDKEETVKLLSVTEGLKLKARTEHEGFPWWKNKAAAFLWSRHEVGGWRKCFPGTEKKKISTVGSGFWKNVKV